MLKEHCLAERSGELVSIEDEEPDGWGHQPMGRERNPEAEFVAVEEGTPDV